MQGVNLLDEYLGELTVCEGGRDAPEVTLFPLVVGALPRAKPLGVGDEQDARGLVARLVECGPQGLRLAQHLLAGDVYEPDVCLGRARLGEHRDADTQR